MANEIYSGFDSTLWAVASPNVPTIANLVAHFRSLDLDVKADVAEAGDSSSGGYTGAYGGLKEWDGTLLLHIPFGGVLISGVGGTVSDLNGSLLAHVRKITRNYKSNVAKGGDSSTLGWKRSVAGIISWDITIDCYADAGEFKANTVEAGATVSITSKAKASGDTGLVGFVTISRLGGFKAGPEAGMIGFTIEGKGHLVPTSDTLTTGLLWTPNALINLALLPLGTDTPVITGAAMVSGIDDFTVNVEGGEIPGISVKLSGDGALVRYT